MNEASHELRNHFYVIFISLFMLCNGILKRRAGTAPILLHDTLCIFAEKVGFYQKKMRFFGIFCQKGGLYQEKMRFFGIFCQKGVS